MKLKSLLANAIFGSIATLTGPESVEKIYQYIELNRPFLQHFHKFVIAVNWTENVHSKVLAAYREQWRRIDPHVAFLKEVNNPGHMFGTILLDEHLFTYAKIRYTPCVKHPTEACYLFKSTEDMLLDEKMLEIEYEPADFYYVPGFSYETILKAGGPSELKKILDEHKIPLWTPQTNFYIIDTAKVEHPYGNTWPPKMEKYLDLRRFYKQLKPWDVHFDDGIKFDMESMLAQTVRNLSKSSLLKSHTVDNLINFVLTRYEADPSHKNIRFKEIGLCHFHDREKGVSEV